MNTDRHSLIKELLFRVSDLPEGEREADLDEVCKDDPQLRKEIEALLRSTRVPRRSS